MMSVRTKQSTGRQAPKLREPTRRDFILYYAVGAAAALVFGGVMIALGWSRVAFILTGFALVAIYVPIGLIVLFGRRERRSATA